MNATLILKHNMHVEHQVTPESITLRLKSGRELTMVGGGTRKIYNTKSTQVMWKNIRLTDTVSGAEVFYPIDRLKNEIKDICEVVVGSMDLPDINSPDRLRYQLVSCVVKEEQPDKRTICFGLPIHYFGL